jgi:SNF2 family DNA or RNA helicase
VEATFKARPYQVEAIRHLLRKPAGGLLMDPGTGKTGSTLAAAEILTGKKIVDKILVVAPLNAVYDVWPFEVEKFGFKFRTVILHGTGKDDALDEPADIYLINYDGLEWLVRNLSRLMKKGERWWLVLDESTKVKHTTTKRFKLLRGVLGRFHRRTALTGTPSPNGLMDLFGQVYALDLGERLGRYITQYRKEYFYPTGYGGYSWMLQEGAEKRIHEKISDLFYRVDDSVLELPPRYDVPVYVRLPTKARRVYDQLQEEFVAELRGGLVTAVNAGVLSSKLRQAASGGLYDRDGKWIDLHDAKVTALVDLVEQLQGNPLLVGYEFTANAHALQKALKKARVAAPVWGEVTNRSERTRLKDAFNAGDVPVLLCQSGAAAHALNLQQTCHTVAWFGVPWNLETYIQFTKRIHRGGQRRTVMVHHLLVRDTIEDTVMWPVLKKKDRSQQALLSAIKKRYV